MVHQLLEALAHWIQVVEATLGYPGVALLMGIESACIPLPSELIMPYAGAMTNERVAAELSAAVIESRAAVVPAHVPAELVGRAEQLLSEARPQPSASPAP